MTLDEQLVKEMFSEYPNSFASRVKLWNYLKLMKTKAAKVGEKSSEFVTYEHFTTGLPAPSPRPPSTPHVVGGVSRSSSAQKMPSIPQSPAQLVPASPSIQQENEDETLEIRGLKVPLLKDDSLIASTITGQFPEKRRNYVVRLQINHLIGEIMNQEGAYRRPKKEEISDLAVLFRRKYPAVGSVALIHSLMKKRSYNDKYCMRKKQGLVGLKLETKEQSEDEEQADDSDEPVVAPPKKKKLVKTAKGKGPGKRSIPKKCESN